VRKESCDTSSSNALAAARVTMAKKMARTRSENSPMRRANRAAASVPRPAPRAIAPKPGPRVLSAMATP
jgi:hypothetical protein